MTRLPGRLAPARAPSSSVRTKFRKHHKVVLESVTQKRKKLRTIISFEANAPPGYTFIPAGNPRFTTACKEYCREQGMKVFTVTTTPHQNTHGLSQQVHRVGYHFPSTVVAKKCMELGLYISENGNVMPFEQFGAKPATTDGNVDVSQITINTEARDVLRDLFPKIPDEDINQIIKTAFQKGQRKVGTATELPLARRAQLAVVAHIRHLYTNYDKLLKTTSFQEARRTVEDVTLEKLVQWRGDDESGMPELEDVFREVIVISDDEEEDTEDGDFTDGGNVGSKERELSVEILSGQVVADKLDLVTNDGNNHSVSLFPIRVSRKPLFSGHNLKTRTSSQALGKSIVDRRGFSRYQAWDRAMDRYREKKLLGHSEQDLPRGPVVSREEAVISSRTLHSHMSQGQASGRPLTPIVERIFDPSFKGVSHDVRPRSSDLFHQKSAYDLRDKNRVQAGPPPPERKAAPDILHFPDGSVFSKIPSILPHKRSSFPVDHSSAPVFVAGPRIFSEGSNETTLKRLHPSTHRPTSNNRTGDSPRSNVIITSIEHRDSPLPAGFPLQHKISDPNILPHVVRDRSVSQYRRPIDELSKGIDLIDLTEDTPEFPKRRRLESQEAPPDLHRSSAYRDEFLNSDARGNISQHAPLLNRSRQFEFISEASRVDRAPVIRKEPAPYIIHRPREETTNRALYYPQDTLRESSRLVPALPTILVDAPKNYSNPEGSTIAHPHIDALPQYRGFNSGTDDYIVEAPRRTHYRVDRPNTSHHSRGSGSDDALWRNKANSYRSQRKLLEAQDPTWSMNVPKNSLHAGRTHSPGLVQENIGEPPVDFNNDSRAENVPLSYGIQGRRISSQPPVSEHQRKRDTLPASALRRYEVQMDRAMNLRNYDPAP